MQNYLQFEFETENAEQAEQLIALLSERDFEGFEEDGKHLNAFIPEEDFKSEAFSEVISLFPSITYVKTVIENINWNQQWESNFDPVIVEDINTNKPWAAIRAHFHEPVKEVAYEIVITPKMSFGTGHHSTTYLMMQQMQLIDFLGKSVFDFGTGTGVLAILAEKMGASKILAIDNDEWSITNAAENITANNCHTIELEQAAEIPFGKQYDVVLANINLNVILNNIEFIANISKKEGKILFSGIFKENEDEIVSKFAKNRLKIVNVAEKGDWIVIIAEKI